MIESRKLVLVGTGMVGMSMAYALENQGGINELVLIDVLKDKAEGEDRTDGISLSFGNWRFNLRCSNTEPVVRLNVESKGDKALVDEKTKEILAILRK